VKKSAKMKSIKEERARGEWKWVRISGQKKEDI
jgi:hypothetical protein